MYCPLSRSVHMMCPFGVHDVDRARSGVAPSLPSSPSARPNVATVTWCDARVANRVSLRHGTELLGLSDPVWDYFMSYVLFLVL